MNRNTRANGQQIRDDFSQKNQTARLLHFDNGCCILTIINKIKQIKIFQNLISFEKNHFRKLGKLHLKKKLFRYNALSYQTPY